MDQPVNLLEQRVSLHLEVIYQSVPTVENYVELAQQLLQTMRLDQECFTPKQQHNPWDQSNIAAITYGDTIKSSDQAPLQTLLQFLDKYCDDIISTVHILPFFPYSSDDGFAVMDYTTVNPTLGSWDDIDAIGKKYRLMADLVINHCSSRSLWFENFRKGIDPGKDYFFTALPTDDTSEVVRPRTNELLREVETKSGTQYVWCTFGHDQIDLDFTNPQVLLEFARIIRLYLDNDICIFRLDAIAFIWKVVGTNCLNLEQTHEIVRLLRTLIEHAREDSVIITETNIPNRENLTYFGNANEAHCIYNFSLPPLLVNTLLTGNCHHLKQWMMSMPPAQNGTAYFNFIASHDGIGLRPAKGLLSEEEIEQLLDTMQNFGGRISWRTGEDNEKQAYEINIALYDALQGTHDGKDEFGTDRFVCAHAIMLALEGIPAFYIHSLIGTHNDHARVENTGHNRAINRRQWQFEELEKALDDPDNQHAIVLKRLKHLIQIRKRQPAFHPNATQFTLHLGDQVFGFWRQSIDRSQSIFSVSNISSSPVTLSLSDINLIAIEDWHDLISDIHFDDITQNIELAPYQTLWITNK